MPSVNTALAPREVRIPVGDTWLYGDLVLSPGFRGLMLFAHGSGRHSARYRQVAQHLPHAGIATLLFDLLTAQEELIDLPFRNRRHAGRVLAGKLNACRRAYVDAPVKGLT